MSRAPSWTKEEFEHLLAHPELDDEALAAQLPQRSAGAVGIVRNGIHSFHRGLNISMLSQMQRERLEAGGRARLPAVQMG